MLTDWPCWATDHARIRVQRRGDVSMKFWLLRPKGFNYHYTDTESCWGCVVRAPDRETALALAATSELRLGDDFPDGWDVTDDAARLPRDRGFESYSLQRGVTSQCVAQLSAAVPSRSIPEEILWISNAPRRPVPFVLSS